jgi:hypothetical protein
MISFRLSFVAPALLMICAGCAANTQSKIAPAIAPAVIKADPWEDQSTVEKTLILVHVTTWYMQFCPPPDQMCFGTTENTRRFIQIHSKIARSREALYRALKMRFGDDGPKIFNIASYRHNPLPPAEMAKGMQRMGDLFLGDLQKMEIRVDANTATIRDPSQKGDVLHARRSNGKWMIELSDPGPLLKEELKATEAYEMGIRQTREITAELTAGKYATASDALAKFKERGKKVQAIYERVSPGPKVFLPTSTQPSQ